MSPSHGLANPRRGFTLVELLVVIAIIGVLIALLLPAVQAAREAARRTQCKNQVKQIMLSMHNHESAKRVFPSGGIGPWPNIAKYLTGANGTGTPLGPEKQGLSWAFQILPYLEGQTTYNIRVQADLNNVVVPMYYCPSRRPPSFNSIDKTYLMDYAAAVPARTRFERPAAPDWLASNVAWGVSGCAQSERDFWTTSSGGVRFESDINSQAANFPFIAPMGVIVRAGYCEPCAVGKKHIPWYIAISFENIEDGSSHTLVIGEKRLQPSLYQVGDWHDDRGWTDGWDPDTLRSTFCKPAQDKDVANQPGASALPYSFGGAHTDMFNAGFADASVQSIKFDIDVEVLNYLGHRADGQQIDPTNL